MAAVQSMLDLKALEIREYGVVLIVPDSFGLGDIEIMVGALLQEMQFKEVVVHADSTAAAFGQGISGGCIVHVDDSCVRISCIEDGVLVPGSAKLLPFGGSQITHALHWMLQTTLPSEFNPHRKPCDKSRMNEIRDTVCFLPGEGPDTAVQNQIRNLPPVQIVSSRDIREIQVGAESCVAPMGLFYPPLLVPHGIYSSHRLQNSSEEFYSQILTDSENSKSVDGSRIECLGDLPLDAAIVKSISATDNVDHRRRLYTSILIVGCYSHLKGLGDMVERRVLSALPSDELIDTVAVLEPKWPSTSLIWKGGIILGSLSDHWVRRDEWIDGVNLRKPNKFCKRDIPQSKVYWMFKTEIGLM